MGSEDTKSQGCSGGGGEGVKGWGEGGEAKEGGGKSQLPTLPLCTMTRVYLSGTQSPLSLTRKGGLCSPTCVQSRTLQKAGILTPCPEKPGRASSQWAQALLGACPEEVLRGIHCPCSSSTTAATPQLCCHHHHYSGPSVTSLHRTQHLLSQLQQHHHSAHGQTQALERLQLLAVLPSIAYCNLSVFEFII